MSKFQTIVIIVLGSIIIGFLNFFLIQTWIDSEESRQTQMIKEAYDRGLEAGIVAIFTNTENCLTTSLFIENQTRQIIDVECLNFIP